MVSFKHVLVATDFSPDAAAALTCAAQLAERFHSRLIRVLTTTHRTMWALDKDVETTRQTEELRTWAAKRLGSKVPYAVELVWGDPARSIVEMARRRRCDLIVMGTHGRSGWDRLVMGSVAEKVVRYAHCPVLIARRRGGRTRRRAAAR